MGVTKPISIRFPKDEADLISESRAILGSHATKELRKIIMENFCSLNTLRKKKEMLENEAKKLQDVINNRLAFKYEIFHNLNPEDLQKLSLLGKKHPASLIKIIWERDHESLPLTFYIDLKEE